MAIHRHLVIDYKSLEILMPAKAYACIWDFKNGLKKENYTETR
jgi:hypothetical protein